MGSTGHGFWTMVLGTDIFTFFSLPVVKKTKGRHKMKQGVKLEVKEEQEKLGRSFSFDPLVHDLSGFLDSKVSSQWNLSMADY